MIKKLFTLLRMKSTKKSQEEPLKTTEVGPTSTSPTLVTDSDKMVDGVRKLIFEKIIYAFDMDTIYHLSKGVEWEDGVSQHLELQGAEKNNAVTYRMCGAFYKKPDLDSITTSNDRFPVTMELLIGLEENHRNSKNYELSFICRANWTLTSDNKLYAKLIWETTGSKNIPVNVYVRLLTACNTMLENLVTALKDLTEMKDKDNQTKERDTVVVPFTKK